MSNASSPRWPHLPPGWSVTYVELPVGGGEFYLAEDLLQAHHLEYGLLADLGWYGDADTGHGLFRMYLFEGDFAGKELEQRTARTLEEALAEFDHMLAKHTARGR